MAVKNTPSSQVTDAPVYIIKSMWTFSQVQQFIDKFRDNSESTCCLRVYMYGDFETPYNIIVMSQSLYVKLINSGYVKTMEILKISIFGRIPSKTPINLVPMKQLICI